MRNMPLLFAYIISSIGDWALKFSLPLYIYHITGSPQSMAISYALTFLPFLLFSIPSGVLSDLVNKKKLLITLDIIGIGLSILLFVVMKENYAIPYLYVSVFLLSSLLTVHHVVFQGSLKQFFSKETLPSINATVTSTDSILSSMGPIIGVIFAVYLGYDFAAIFNAMSYILSGIILCFTHITPFTVKKEPLWTMVKDGIQGTIKNGFVRFGACLFFMTNFALNLFLGVFIFHLKKELLLSDLQVGLVYSCAGLFAVLGAYTGKRICHKVDGRLALSIAVILSGIITLPIAFLDNWILVSLCWSVFSFFGAMNVVIFFTQRQKHVPMELLSRVVGVSRLIAYASIPLGAVLGGYMITWVGFEALTIFAGCYRIIVGLWAWFTLRKSLSNPVPNPN